MRRIHLTMNPTTLLAASFLLASVFFPSAARADDPAAVVKALEEELDAVKETQEKNELELRKLRERLESQQKTIEAQSTTVVELRKRVQEAEALKLQLQALEARINEVAENGPSKRSASTLDIGIHADVRVRPELSNNRTDFRSESDGNFDDLDSFWGHRVRLGANLGVQDWVETNVVIQEARVFGQTSSTAGGFGLHEGWAEIRPPWAEGLSLRGGRTELAFGRERLVGTDDFGLAGQAFDGVVVRYENAAYIAVDAFYAKTRETTGVEADGAFFGLYASTNAIPFSTVDLYYLGLVDEFDVAERTDVGESRRTEKRNIHTIGLRFEGLYFDSLYVEGEAIVQLGGRTDPVDPTRELDHLATAYYAELSYQIPVVSLPTIGAFFTTASGDANPRDQKSVDFIPLFPSRHSLLGKMDLFGWSNIVDVGGTLEVTPPRGFGLYGAFHYFLLAQGSGKLSGGLGSGKTPDPADEDLARQALGKNVGMEVDLIASWSPSDLVSLEAGYSFFLPLKVLESLGYGGNAAHWAYLQLRVQY